MHIHPSTLESLTRSGTEATSSRARKTDIDMPISEEDPGTANAPDAGIIDIHSIHMYIYLYFHHLEVEIDLK